MGVILTSRVVLGINNLVEEVEVVAPRLFLGTSAFWVMAILLIFTINGVSMSSNMVYEAPGPSLRFASYPPKVKLPKIFPSSR